MYDHSYPTTGSHRSLPGRTFPPKTWGEGGGSCLLHPKPGTQSVCYSLWRELQSRTQDPITGHVFMNICIPDPGASIWRFLYQGTTKIIFLHSDFLLSIFPLLPLSFSLFSDQISSSFLVFVQGSLNSESGSHVYHLNIYCWGEMNKKESTLLLTLDSCSYQYKWFKISLLLSFCLATLIDFSHTWLPRSLFPAQQSSWQWVF